MVHVEKIKVKGNIYYKLVHNIRKEGKVKSKSKYLGKELPAPKVLERLKKAFYEEIKKRRLEETAAPSKEKITTHASHQEEVLRQALHKQKLLNQKLTNTLKQKAAAAAAAAAFKSITESLPEMVYWADPVSFAPTYVNKTVEKIFGYSPKEWLADPHLWEQRIYPGDRMKIMEALWQAKKKKVAVDISYRIITHDNKLLWVTNHINWEKDTQGNITALLGIIEEITTKKETEDKFQLLFHDSPVAMLEQDFSALKQYLNTYNLTTEEEIQKRFEKNPFELREVMGMVKVANLNSETIKLFKAKDKESFLKIYYAKQFCRDSTDVFIKELAAIAKNEDSFETSVNIFSMDGKRTQIFLKWHVPHIYKGNYGKVLVTLVDTSLQRQLAKRMHIKNYAIESSNSALLITDLEGKITYANQAFFTLWDIEDYESVMEQSVENYLPYEKGSMKILQEVHLHKEWRGVLTLQKKNPVYLDTTGKFVHDDFGEPLGLVFSFIDITELKQTENIRLEFTNIAAHELKTPIVPMKTFLTMMQDEPEKYGLNKQGQEFVEVCVRNVSRLNYLIGDILDISRLEAGGMKFKMAKFDLLKEIRSRIKDFAASATEKGLHLRSQLPPQLPLLHADKGRIGQVIGNLIKNAINFTDVGSILVTAKGEDNKVKVSVTDTGLGISKQDQQKLFTKFFQAEDITTRKTKGSGLGLAICKKIIEAHAGEIWVTSEGRGSTFTFTLPIQAKKLPSSATSQTPGKKEEHFLLGEKILLSEDQNKKAK